MPTRSPDPAQLLTTAQACIRLDCSRSTIRKLWKEGKLERVKFGGQTRITRRSLDALVDAILHGEMLRP